MDEREGYGYVRNGESFAVHASERKFVAVVVAAIIKGYGEADGVFVFVEHGDRVHASRDDDNGVFHCRRIIWLLKVGCMNFPPEIV